ncbi:MAG: hypothetical protein KJ065_20440 [Anaerolineae bacterium]|nr:hypothetical protein [Anaerolineae bacterium]
MFKRRLLTASSAVVLTLLSLALSHIVSAQTEVPVAAQTDSHIRHISWNHMGTLLAVVTYDDFVSVFDGQSNQPVWQHPVDDSVPVSWNPQIPTQLALAVAGSEPEVEIWDVQTGALVLTLETAGWLQDIAYSPDGSLIATAHGNSMPDFAAKVQIWNAANGQLVAETRRESRYITSLTWSPTGDRIAGIARNFDQAIVWNAATGEEIAAFPPYNEVNPDFAWSVHWSPTGNRIFTYLSSVGYAVWDAQTYTLQTTLSFAGGSEDWALDPTGQFVALADYFGFSIVDIVTQRVIFEQRTPGRVNSIAWRPDGRAVSVGGDIPLRTFELTMPTPTPAIATPDASAAQTENPNDPLHLLACGVGCYYGLIPGLSTEAALQALLSEKNAPYTVGELGYGGVITVYSFGPLNHEPYVREDPNAISVKVGLGLVDAIVHSISVELRNVTVADVVRAYGAPTSITHRDAIVMVYTQYGLIFMVDDENQSDVMRVEIVAPGADSRLTAYFLSWPTWSVCKGCQ